MTGLATMLAVPVLLGALAQANPPQVVHGRMTPAPPLPALPVIARVRLDVGKDRVLVVHEIVMGRGDYAGGDLDLWTSFGPTMPRAFDAHLLSMPPSSSAPDPTDQGEPIPMDMAARRPPNAHLLLGRASMAGVVLHLREPALRRALAASNVLALRVREIVSPPTADARGARELVVRLGLEGSTPLAIRRLDISTSEPQGWLTAASAQLCGPNADPYLIGFASSPRAVSPVPMAIDPSAATRRSTDDLCIRYVAPP